MFTKIEKQSTKRHNIYLKIESGSENSRAEGKVMSPWPKRLLWAWFIVTWRPDTDTTMVWLTSS